MEKGKIEAMVTKFSEKFAIIMLKSLENFVGVAWLIWMPHPLFKNRPNTYGTPCSIPARKLQSLKLRKPQIFALKYKYIWSLISRLKPSC